MVRQVGEAEFDNRGMMKKGVIVRQLLLPGHVKDAKNVLKYLYETQKNNLDHISAIHPYSTGKFMIIDSSTRRNLELVETMRENRNVVRCSGYWTRPKLPWVQEPFVLMWSSL